MVNINLAIVLHQKTVCLLTLIFNYWLIGGSLWLSETQNNVFITACPQFLVVLLFPSFSPYSHSDYFNKKIKQNSEKQNQWVSNIKKNTGMCIATGLLKKKSKKKKICYQICKPQFSFFFSVNLLQFRFFKTLYCFFFMSIFFSIFLCACLFSNLYQQKINPLSFFITCLSVSVWASAEVKRPT